MLGEKCFRFGVGELVSPFNAAFRACPFAGGLVLGKIGCLLAMRLPVMPAFGADRGVHLRVYENRAAKITPRPAEIDPLCRVLACEG